MTKTPFESAVAAVVDALPIPRAKIRFGVIAVLLALLLFRPDLAITFVPIACFAALEISLAARLMRLYKELDPKWVRVVLRLAVRTRRTMEASKRLEFLYLLALGIGLGSMILFLWDMQEADIAGVGMLVAAFVLVSAGAIDFLKIFAKLAKMGWAQTTGKVTYAAIAGMSVWLAGAFARDFVAHASRRDPKEFVDATLALQVVFSPLIALWLCIAIVSVVSLLAFVAVTMFTSVLPILRLRRSAPRLSGSKGSLLYRLLHGPNREDTQRSVVEWKTILFGVRPLAIAGLASLLFTGYSVLGLVPMSTVDSVVAEIIVRSDFLPNQECDGKVVLGPVHHLERGKMLLAKKVGGKWVIERSVCEAQDAGTAQTSNSDSQRVAAAIAPASAVVAP